MKESWRPQPERLIKEKLPSRREKQVRAAHHFSDLHGSIIDNDGKLIARHAIVSPHHEITEIFAREKALLAKKLITEDNYLTIGNPEPPVRVATAIRRRPGTASSWVNRLLFTLMRSFQRAEHIFTRANTRIDRAAIPKF